MGVRLITDGELPMGAFRYWKKKNKDWEFPKIDLHINVDKIRLKKNQFEYNDPKPAS